ncbi:MAG: hypothetical protein H6564_13070 [Lewinellaceae bacterium]|nr:hypothetical protein [Lewinellaceae bacterium]
MSWKTLQNEIDPGGQITTAPVSDYQTSLNQTACELIDSFPTEFQNQFKVISMGFYLYNPIMIPGIGQFRAKAIQDAENESAFYLLITRQSDNTGLFKKFYVDLKLPNSGAFSCLDSTAVQNIKQTVKQAIDQSYLQSGGSPYNFASAEIAGMEILAQIIGDIKSGNCCVPSDEAITDWLTSEGFVELNVPCNILGPINPARPSNDPNRAQKTMTGYVTDLAELSVELNGEPVILEDEINAFIAAKGLEDSNPIFYVTKNSSVCNGDYDFAESEIITNLPNLGGIVYLQDRLLGNDKIYLRLEGLMLEDVPATFADLGEYTPPPPGGATSFQDLVNIIREAEDSLINNGYQSIEDRVRILRGIYYGTTWSMDFEQSYGSTLRNAGFKAYLCTTSDPINPEQIFGSALYDKLKRSPEVTNGSMGVDWGHIIIGLEARMSWCSREIPISFHESSGLEITTWIGDIGGGAGMLAYKRVSNPNKRAKDMFSGSSDFGGWINLEGDIAAFLVGRDTNNFDLTPSTDLDDDDYIADAVEAYLLPQPATTGSEWHRRGELFLRMLGGNFNNSGQLTNEENLVTGIASEVEDFAENYVIVMAVGRNNDNNSSNDVNMYETSKHLAGASKEMTEIFVHTLKNAVSNPNQPVKAQGFNPNPTPAGEPYTKYKTIKKTKELIQEFEDWWNN